MSLKIILLFLFSCAVPKTSSENQSIFSPSTSEELVEQGPLRRWQNYPIIYQFSSDFTSQEKNTLTQEMINWNKDVELVQVENSFFNKINPVIYDSFQQNISQFYSSNDTIPVHKINHWENFGFDPQAIGVTFYTFTIKNKNTSEEYHLLKKAFILINYSKNNISLNKQEGYFHLPSILVHEVGHSLGLRHFKTSEHVMFFLLLKNQEKISPSEEESLFLKQLYEQNIAFKSIEEDEEEFISWDYIFPKGCSINHIDKQILEIKTLP